MLSEKLAAALNDQLNFELYSAYFYYSMTAYFDSRELKGMATWTLTQAKEELVHVQKFFTFLSDMDGRVLLAPVAGPTTDWPSAVSAFEDGFKHEQALSVRIGKLMDLATAEGSHATVNFLRWFVTEQVEEMALFKNVVERLRMIGESGSGLFLLDMELGKRSSLGATE